MERVTAACARSGRSPESVRVVAVSKTFSVDAVCQAYEAGARLFGENYLQEALPKIAEFQARVPDPDVSWHFVGSLQSNKAKKAAPVFSLIHSLDRWSLAKELDKAAKQIGCPVETLVEVNIGGEETKSGCPSEKLLPFLRQISENTSLVVRGLMAFPPYPEHGEESRPYFVKTRELVEEARSLQLPRIQMKEISMGVTSDYEIAVEEGATLVRVGTAIFGMRAKRA